MVKDIQSIGIMPSQLDENGLVSCWHIEEKRWFKLLPIDARERTAAGEINTRGPDGEANVVAARGTPEEHEAAFAALSKAKLRLLCVNNNVEHTGSDTKVSLIKRLLTAGIVPE